MTKVEALVAADGIVVASDGNVYDVDRNVIASDHIKQFELSPLCVVMAAGNISLGLPDMMAAMRQVIIESGDWHASRVAEFLCNQCNEASDMEGGKWLKNDTTMFNIAGYDYIEGGTFQPVLLALFRRKGKWLLNEATDKRLMIGGYEMDKWHDLMGKRLEKVTPSLLNYNRLAVNAIADAEKLDPGIVGGQITLWNILPALENTIVKFSNDEVEDFLNGQ